MSVIEYVDHSTVRLEKYLASDEAVARAAWVSFDAEEARTKDAGRISGLINFLYSNKHMSPFEHGYFQWFIDTPIFVVREFHRHRTWSYNEVSGRYREFTPRFYLPPRERPLTQVGKPGSYTFVAGTDEQYAQMIVHKRNTIETAWAGYQAQLDLDIAKEVARDELPVSTMTQFYASTDPRNVMAFLTLRNDKHALWEIRQVAAAIEEDFKAKMPLTWATFDKNRTQWNNARLVMDKLTEEEWEELLERVKDR